ncbi:unnamed protein product, partial [Dibothriocephalus latus]
MLQAFLSLQLLHTRITKHILPYYRSPEEPQSPTPVPTGAAAGAAQGKEAKQKKKALKGVVPAMQSLSLESSGPKLDILPKRPDSGGTLGRPVIIEANCWDMTIK